MKRRGFLAGLLAAPAVVALAPQAEAKAPAPRTMTETMLLSQRPKRSGFTAEELQNIADESLRVFLKNHSKPIGYRTYFLTDNGFRQI